MKRPKCSESTVLGELLQSPLVSTSPLLSACFESIDSGTDESTVLGDPLPSPFVSTSTLVSACSESIDSRTDNQINGYPLTSPPPNMLTLSPVTDLIPEEKISADNDQQKVSPDDEKLTNEPTHITNNLTYAYLPQGNFFTYYL